MEQINLNLVPNGLNPICHCSQYDVGRVIRVNLFDGSVPYEIASDDTITLNVRKPDNTIVTTSLTASEGNSFVDIVTSQQMCACAGNNLCDLSITNNDNVIGTLNFIMEVERDVLTDGIPSQSVIRDLNALIAEAVANQYDSGNVIFDDEPTPGHGVGYAVTSEGVYGVWGYGTLPAGATSLTINNAKIKTDSSFDIYTDHYGVNPLNITNTAGSITMTFEAQANDIKVKVRVL